MKGLPTIYYRPGGGVAKQSGNFLIASARNGNFSLLCVQYEALV